MNNQQQYNDQLLSEREQQSYVINYSELSNLLLDRNLSNNLQQNKGA